jgi:hypothetical protein
MGLVLAVISHQSCLEVTIQEIVRFMEWQVEELKAWPLVVQDIKTDLKEMTILVLLKLVLHL